MRNILGISWLNGTLKVAVCHGSTVKASWECPHRVDHLGELAPPLREAILSTGFTGTDVTMVINLRSLIYHLQEAPPGKPGALRPLLQRQISQANFFEEEAVWSHHQSIPSKANQSFLLTLLPRSVMMGLNGVCSELGLTLIGVYSPAAVLARQFKFLHLKPNEAALLAADLGGSLCLVAGNAEGNILFCRHVSHSSSHNQDRAAQEINRTLLFVQQKFGFSINTLWIFGQKVFSALSGLKIREGMVIHQSPVQESPNYLNSACATLSPLDSTNLVSTQEVRRRQFRRSLALVCSCLIASGLATTMMVNPVVQARQKGIDERTKSWNQLEQHRDQLLFRQREVMLLEKKLDLLGSPEDPPTAELFVRYLATAIPDAVTLTGLSLAQSQPGYQVRLEGFTRDPDTPVLPVLESLEGALTNGLFQLQITDSTRKQIFGNGQAQTTSSRSVNRLRLPQGQRRFFIEGHWK